jgi:hypothetical protein
MSDRITEKQDYSTRRLSNFKEELNKSDELKKTKDLCIYTTGSYGRLEACEFSDIDLFFLHGPEDQKFSKIHKTLIDADIINITRRMAFPEFSGDGEYLEIHNINHIHKELGSRKDDYLNYFTARMLLLLESRPIYNDSLYEKIIDETIDKYYKDFHEHEKDFEPVFIVNDVIRFWRTMCLNYEHNRNRKAEQNQQMNEEQIKRKKSEAHIKNLKLKFSRKLTCYSFLLSVLYSKMVLKKEDIKDIIIRTPLQRIQDLSSDQTIKPEIDQIIDLYFWFLNITQIPKDKLLDWIQNDKNRDDAFDRSRQFAKLIYDVMIKKNDKNLMYFLV